MDITTEIRNEFNRVDALARSIFPRWAQSRVPALTFFVKGRTAGWARYNLWEVSINKHIASQNLAMMRDTVSHEVAHMVAFFVYGERGHGQNWKMVHRMLGGTAERCYSASEHGIKAIPGRRTNQYLYRSPVNGYELWIGARHHNGLRDGKYSHLNNSNYGGKILTSHFTGQSRKKP